LLRVLFIDQAALSEGLGFATALPDGDAQRHSPKKAASPVR